MEDKMLYKDPSQPVDVRVEDLLSRMTLEEKAAQLCGDLAASFIVDGKLSHEALKEKFKDGHGRITQYSLVGLVSPKQIAEITNELQDFFVNETRLGIPVALQSENLCGYPGAGGTLFPAQINVGSTWEPELAEEMSSIIGQESRAVGITSAMSPVIDVSRDPDGSAFGFAFRYRYSAAMFMAFRCWRLYSCMRLTWQSKIESGSMTWPVAFSR